MILYKPHILPRGIFSLAVALAGTPPLCLKRLLRLPHKAFMLASKRLAAVEGCKLRKSRPLVRFSATLRWLAGGPCLGIAMAHSLPTSTAYHEVAYKLFTFPKPQSSLAQSSTSLHRHKGKQT